MSEHEPRKGDKLWDEERRKNGKQPNGVITRVDYQSGIVLVVWLDSKDLWSEYDIDHIKEHYVNETMGYMLKDYEQGSEF